MNEADKPNPDDDPQGRCENDPAILHAATLDAATVRGGSIPGLARPAFTYHPPVDGGAGLHIPPPVLVAVPHAGRDYPSATVEQMRHGVDAMVRLEDRHVDAIARRVAAMTGVGLLLAHAPRAMLDLNRDPRDLDPAMFIGDKSGMMLGPRSRRGLGLFPRRLAGSGDIWRGAFAAEEAGRRIAAIHTPYHRFLSSTLDGMRDRFGEAVLLDLHSMPSLNPATRDGDPRGGATHVLGDRFGASCSAEFSGTTLDSLARCGVVASHNRPYAGGYVLERHGKPSHGIHAIQLEIDRATYLDSRNAPVAAGVERQAAILAALIRDLAALVDIRAARKEQAAE